MFLTTEYQTVHAFYLTSDKILCNVLLTLKNMSD